jgi:WD40 repeat protein
MLATAGAGVSDRVVRLWDPDTGQPIRSLPADPGSFVTAVAFSPDGKLLATADAGVSAGVVRLWDLATGQPIGSLPTGTDSFVTPAFSPDGKLLATAGGDGTVKLWAVSLFSNPYGALCADVGPLTRQEWQAYAPGEPFPKTCA